jgi:HTH-type transcriptional regulator/antitoxin HigA
MLRSFTEFAEALSLFFGSSLGSQDKPAPRGRSGDREGLRGTDAAASLAMDIRPIKTQRDYRRVLKEIEGLMSAKRNTPQGDRLDVLVTLVEAFEARRYPLDLADAVDAIKYHMEQKGLAPPDLIPFIGNRNRVNEVLARRRPLTLEMVQRLHAGLGIPAESLIRTGGYEAA